MPLFDFTITPEDVEVRLLGALPVYRLRNQDVVSAHVLEGPFQLPAALKRGSQPWNTLRIGTRWRLKWVLLETRQGWPRFLAITPDNPDGFVASLTPTGTYP